MKNIYRVIFLTTGSVLSVLASSTIINSKFKYV